MPAEDQPDGWARYRTVARQFEESDGWTGTIRVLTGCWIVLGAFPVPVRRDGGAEKPGF